MVKYILSATLFLSLCLSLSSCGKKGSPQPPGPSEDLTYPRAYPTE